LPCCYRSELGGSRYGFDHLITKASRYSAQETIERFETAVKAKGFVVFGDLDHAAAAAKVGLELRPRTVIVFGNPKVGTPSIRRPRPWRSMSRRKRSSGKTIRAKCGSPTTRADPWGATSYHRHGLAMNADVRKNIDQLLDEVSNHATK